MKKDKKKTNSKSFFKKQTIQTYLFLATPVVSPIQLLLEKKQKKSEKQENKNSGPIPLLGLDFNLATSIFRSQLDLVENNFPSPTKKQEVEKKETQQDLFEK